MMKRTAGNTNFGSIFWHQIVRFIALSLLCGMLETLALAQTRNDLSGIRNSSGARRLSSQQLQQVRETLSRKSGFTELGFDEQGTMTLGNRQNVVGGSATARALLIAGVDNNNLFELENHSQSDEVAFAQLYECADWVIGETGKHMTVFRVQVDFDDFKHLSGANEAKATFDLGIALLHELTHGVLRLPDTQEIGQIGDCDAHVNQIRRELRLPERLYYQPNITIVQTNSKKRIVVAHLEFAERSGGQTTKYRLGWFPAHVSPNARNIALLEKGLAKAR
ncbi:MAG: hypothetical protein JNK38_26955 [Acidobacteria bacterium]|nr:hypothetical protein [Acidobacteriota bacterium]